MVNYQYIFSCIIVPLIASFIVCILVLGRVYVNQLKPLLEQAQAGQDAIDVAVKKAMSAMGDKSVAVRQGNKLERMVAGDIIDQFPEIEMILGIVSPTTAEALRENPERALQMLERYKDYLPLLTGDTETKPNQYDL